MPEAQVRQATTTVHIIEGHQLKEADTLTIGNKELLTVKGGNSQHLVTRVLTEFSRRLDRAGKPFTMSRKWRGLAQTDPYGAPSRISGPELEAFLAQWFVFCELVHSAPPQAFNSAPLLSGQQQYLKILYKLPSFTAALVSQSRFVTNELVQLFQVID